MAGFLMILPAVAETPVATGQMTKAQARERLAACGTQWQQMKHNGAEGALIWREFSATCMAQPAASPGAPTTKTNTRHENAPPAR